MARDRNLVLGREDQAMQGNGNSPLQEEIFEEAGFGEAFNAQQDLRSSDEQAMRYKRTVTDPWVGPEGAQRHQKMAEAAAHRLIDNWIEDGEVDFVKGFAAPLPQTVITTILGLHLRTCRCFARWRRRRCAASSTGAA